MISGILMFSMHGNDFGRGMSLDFLKKRLIRVVPMYYLATAITAIAFFVNPSWFSSTQIAMKDVLYSMLFLPSYYLKESDSLVPVLGVGWTLCFEMLFYTIFTVGLALNKTRGLALIFSSILILVLVGLVKEMKHDTLIYFFSNNITIFFLIGILMEPVYTKGININRNLKAAILLCSLLIDIYAKNKIINLVFLPVFFIFALDLLRNLKVKKSLVYTLAISSYSTYLFHRLIMGAINSVSKHIPILSKLPHEVYGLILISLSLLIGYAIYLLIESRIAKIIKYFSNRKSEILTNMSVG